MKSRKAQEDHSHSDLVSIAERLPDIGAWDADSPASSTVGPGRVTVWPFGETAVAPSSPVARSLSAYRSYYGSSSDTSVGGHPVRYASNGPQFSLGTGFTARIVFGHPSPRTAADENWFVGWANSLNATPRWSVIFGALKDTVGVRLFGGSSPTWEFYANDASGSGSTQATSIGFAADGLYSLQAFVAAGATSVTLKLVDVTNDVSESHTFSSDVPATTVALKPGHALAATSSIATTDVPRWVAHGAYVPSWQTDDWTVL